MNVQLITMASLLERLRQDSGQTTFLEEYRGVFLLAMGFLSAEVLRSKNTKGTSAIAVDARMIHDRRSSHPLAGCAFHLRGDDEAKSEVTIGRGSGCAMTVPDPSVSETHCTLRLTEEGLFVVDQSSRNGTSINMKRIEPRRSAVLADEDILTVGRYSFQVLSANTLFSALLLLSSLNA